MSLPKTLERSKNQNSVETQQGSKTSPQFTPDQTLVHYKQSLRTLWRQIEKSELLNVSQFGSWENQQHCSSLYVAQWCLSKL
jgi:hypothetical protein